MLYYFQHCFTACCQSCRMHHELDLTPYAILKSMQMWNDLLTFLVNLNFGSLGQKSSCYLDLKVLFSYSSDCKPWNLDHKPSFCSDQHSSCLTNLTMTEQISLWNTNWSEDCLTLKSSLQSTLTARLAYLEGWSSSSFSRSLPQIKDPLQL